MTSKTDGIKLTADKVRVSGPRVDGSFAVTFEVGEYAQDEVAKLLTIPQQTLLQVVVSCDD
jgi:hypothetical protein